MFSARMGEDLKKGVVVATVVHALFFLTILFFAFWSPPAKEWKPILTLVTPPESPELETPGPPAPVVFEFDIPHLPPPQPPPPPPPVVRPPPPTPPPPLPPTRYEDFRRQHPDRPRPPTTTPAPRPRPIEVPRIETPRFQIDTEPTTPGSSAPSVSPSEMDSFFDRIRAAVRDAWREPAGLHDHLNARVSFHVTPDGRITNASIRESSGNPVFDDLVLETFRRAAPVGAPPDRRLHSLTLDFHMRD